MDDIEKVFGELFEDIEDYVTEAAMDMVRETLEEGELNAKALCPAGEFGTTTGGHLKESIHTQPPFLTEGVIKASLFTNTEHAAFVELGTGPNSNKTARQMYPGEVAHRSEGWWIPVGDGPGKMSLKTAKGYNSFTWTSPDGKQYAYTKGQAAQPFMYPAALRMEVVLDEKINRILEELKDG